MKEKVQKLSVELKNTPRCASQASCSVSSALNRAETLRVQNMLLADNNSDENRSPNKEKQDLRVPVLNLRGKPLMPTTPAKAKRLLKSGKAKVIKRTPFVIQLTIPTGETKQNVILGVDSGYSEVGFSVITEKKELMSGQLTLRKDVSKKLEERRMYRRMRRSRLWHRKPRFNNRKKEEGWIPPSLQHKLDAHIKLIEKLKSWFPITKTIIEIAKFDQQKMQNPEISGIEYQKGELFGQNVREYLLEKWGRKCAYCGKRDIPLEIEHIIPISRGGSNRVSNLTISCRKCNLKKGNKTAEEFGFPEIQTQVKKPLKSTAFMNIVRKRLAKQINAEETFGYITKFYRSKYNLEKSHVNDAFVIAGGINQERCKSYTVTQTRRNNRCLQINRKGYKPSIRRQRYKLQPNDLVRYNKSICRVKGVFSYGKWVTLIDKFGNIFNSNIKKVELVKYGKGIQFA